MDRTLWVVQENLGSSDDVERLLAALGALEQPYRCVSIVPFSDSIPEIDWDGPIVAYGATRFIANVHKSAVWKPGTFFDPDAFTVDRYIRHYGHNVLNQDALFTTIRDFESLRLSPNREVFVRPARDLKEFEASVCDVRSLGNWFSRVSEGGFELSPDTPVLIAEPVVVDKEWRTFVVDGACLSGSLYQSCGEPRQSPEIPSEVIEFSTQMAKAWSPARVFALDIGQVGTDLKVIEANCFNSSGFYASDIEEVVSAVSSLAQRVHSQRA